MTVVSDTTAITNLIQVGQLSLLQKLYGDIMIPEGVFYELCRVEGQEEILQKAGWIVVQTPKNQSLVNELLKVLDLGESEAIALAVEVKAEFLIIDEAEGRTVAQSNGLRIVGLLGILAAAKTAGHIRVVRPTIEKLLANGFYLHSKLVETVLVRLNE